VKIDQGENQSFGESGVERTFDNVLRELRQYTSRELVILIMWPRQNPAIIARYGQQLLDLYLAAARFVLRERHGRGHADREAGAAR
jgi:hypothetical protein